MVDGRDVFVRYALPDACERKYRGHVGGKTGDAFLGAARPYGDGGSGDKRQKQNPVEAPTHA